MAKQLGTPFMPWQQQVADVVLEVDPLTGRLAYREWTLTVPRQSGKTTLILALAVHRALALGPARIVYTAQTRLDARKKWEDDQVPVLDASPFASLYRVRKTTGNEAVIFANGSHYGIMSVTKKSGHGPTIDVAFIDEAFAQEDARLEQATKPSMITRPQPQMVIVSTAGDEKSALLRAKVDAGRPRAEAGMTAGSAYFEWSADIDADPEDEETWWSCMPALGRTVSVEAIRADFTSMPLREFRRAYLNQWLDLVPDEWLIIPKLAWEAARAEPAVHGPVALAVDVSPGERWGSVVAAWRRPDGNMDVEVADRRPGTAWMPARVTEIVRRHRPVATVIDGASGTPAESLIDELEARGVEVTRPNVREVAGACAAFVDMVTDSRTLRHPGDEALDLAAAGAAKRELGDGWAWTRKHAAVDISPLVGATLACWAHGKFAARQAPYNMLRSVG